MEMNFSSSFGLPFVILLTIIIIILQNTFTLSTCLQQQQVAILTNTDHKQASINESRNSYIIQGDNGTITDTTTDGESQETGNDLNFNLLNTSNDRIFAVENLLNAQRSLSIEENRMHYDDTNQRASGSGSTQSHNPSSSIVCTHKGRKYMDGQMVPIEDQPCLNCTCTRAILQCYLRVCPPVISLEAQKRALALSGQGEEESTVGCRMVKESHQCCPSINCESNETKTILTTDTMSNESMAVSDTNLVSVGNTMSRDNPEASQQQQQQMTRSSIPVTNRSVATDDLISTATSTTPSYQQNPSPKVTFIKGSGGQRDSILLITSNPGSILTQQHSLARSGNATQGDPQGALLDALIETVYSSAAQLNGLDIQGSCMINGSLYVEGSAVIPDGSSYCQYCYCIRQKVMCVRPKCHLSISGCTPKYSNEYACCPTSFTCTSSSTNSMRANFEVSSPNRLSSGLLHQTLSAKLSAAIDSLSRMSQLSTRQADDIGLDPVVARQIDGGSEERQDANSPMTNLTERSTTLGSSQPTLTTTTTTTTTSTTTTSTPAPESKQDDDDDDDTGRGAIIQDNNVTSILSTTEQPSSVSDFLEPMNKLGPLVMSPAAPSSCLENGRQYAIGEQIPTLESCKHCYCGLDGLKECKIIECGLKVSAHNCKPIIPEGHCCPVRYECSNGTSSSQRYRSDSSPKPAELVDLAFKNVVQCKSSFGEDCQKQNESDQMISTPVFRTTRIIDDQSPSTTPLPTSNVTAFSPRDSNDTNLSLTEELSKFIMQIKQNSTSHQPMAASSGHHMNDPPRTQEMMINDQRSRMVDYHSVQATPSPSVEAPDLPRGVTGIPSIVPEPVSNLLSKSNRVLQDQATAEPPVDPASLSTGSSSSGQRDSRSTNAHRFNTPDIGEFSTPPQVNPIDIISPPPTALPNFQDRDQPASSPNDEDYTDQSDGERRNNHSEAARIRLLRNNHVAFPVAQITSSRPIVTFDDELNGSAQNNTGDSRVDEMRPSMMQPGNALVAANRDEDETGTEPKSEPPTTTIPSVPTTGTPIGMDTDRTPETAGWLRSISGAVQSFGRRLIGNTPIELQGAATVGSGNDQNTTEISAQHLAPSLDPSELATGRSRQVSLFNQILKSMIGSGAQVVESRNQQREYVLRPLLNVVQPSSSGDNKPRSPYEPSISDSSKVEVVSTNPKEGQDRKSDAAAAVPGMNTFARRSDIPLDDDVESTPGSLEPEEKTEDLKLISSSVVTSAKSSQKMSLNCTDSLSGKVYLQNEIIPKGDPCKTCTCVLGKELCSTLKCPSKPDDNCREEKRPGECCPNYLCGSNLTQLAFNTDVAPPAQDTNTSGMSARLVAAAGASRATSGSPAVAQRAMHVDSDQRPTNNAIERATMMMPRQQLTDQQRTNLMKAQMQQHLPQHPVRISDLPAHILPPHLRIRQQQVNNNMQSNSNTDLANQNNRVHFRAPNQQNNASRFPPIWMQPAGSRSPLATNSNNNNNNNLDFRFSNSQQRPNIGGPMIRPQILTHPSQRGTQLSNGMFDNRFQPSNGSPTRRFSVIDEPSASRTSLQTTGSDSGSSSSSWLPSGETNPSISNNMLVPSFAGVSTVQQPSPSTDVVDFSAETSTRIPVLSMQTTSRSDISADGGFRPISILVSTTSTTRHQLDSTTTTTMAPPQTTPEAESSSTTTSSSSGQDPSSTAGTGAGGDNSQQNNWSPSKPVIMPPAGYRHTDELTQDSPVRPVSSLVTDEIPEVTKETPTTTTTTTTSTTTSSISEQSNEASSPNDSLDPFAMFRVSECNIYGRIYKVGQNIDELSEACKLCTCTKLGVECNARAC